MNKGDLKTGMLVKDREGSWYVVLKDTGIRDILIDIKTGENIFFSQVTDGLKSSYGINEYDIITVATCYLGDIFTQIAKGTPVEDIDDFHVVFQRSDVEC